MPRRLTVFRIENGIAFLDEVIFTKRLGDGDHRPLHTTDLPEGLLPTDEIYVRYDEGFYSENNSWDPFTEVIVIRERPETDVEREIRLKEASDHKIEMKNRRYQNYLKLKEEFEAVSEIDPAKVIVREPVMIKENQSEPLKTKICHAEEDGYTHAACASQPSCEDCAAYR